MILAHIEEKDLTKLYYSIGEVADMFDVNTSLIRFWEKEFSIIKPKKNNKGNRLFTPKEILKIQKIYHLVKEKGYTLDGAKKAIRSKGVELENRESLKNTNDELIGKLESIKSRLLRLKS